MTIERSEIEKIAKLARLSINEDEMELLKNDLPRIVSFVEQLNEVDVTDVKPMTHAGDRSLSFREDEPGQTIGRKSLQNSQGYEDGLIRVPKIIE